MSNNSSNIYNLIGLLCANIYNMYKHHCCIVYTVLFVILGKDLWLLLGPITKQDLSLPLLHRPCNTIQNGSSCNKKWCTKRRWTMRIFTLILLPQVCQVTNKKSILKISVRKHYDSFFPGIIIVNLFKFIKYKS